MKETALELGKKIQDREVSVKEIAEQSLRRIQATEPRISAFNTIEEEVIERAVDIQKRIDSEGIHTLLAGVPMAIKDNICSKGMRTTCSSKMLEGFIPPYSARVVESVMEAGGLVLGKTNMDEFAMGSTTETSYFGVTRNPWNEDYVPGGSSGGSAAAVAAGMVPYALGSDTGGSIRQPSSFCGVVGLKPTYGLVSRYGLISYGSSLDQIGPITRNVSDCAAVLDMITVYDSKDSTCVKRSDSRFMNSLEEDIRGLRIAIPEEYLGAGLQAEVKDAVIKAANALENMGAEVDYIKLGMTDYVIPTYYVLASAEASSNLGRFDGVKYGYRAENIDGMHDMYKKSRTQGFGFEVKKRIMLGTFVLSSGYYEAYYLKALKAKALIKNAFSKVFQEYDVILGPTAPTTAPLLGESLKDPMQMYLSDIYTVAANLAGLPAISIPCGLDKKGLPIGIQFTGDCFQEKNILHVAYAYEKTRGQWELPFMKEDM